MKKRFFVIFIIIAVVGVVMLGALSSVDKISAQRIASGPAAHTSNTAIDVLPGARVLKSVKNETLLVQPAPVNPPPHFQQRVSAIAQRQNSHNKHDTNSGGYYRGGVAAVFGNGAIIYSGARGVEIMSSNDYVYLFQVLYGQLATGLFVVLILLLVWQLIVEAYKQRKEDSREIVVDDQDYIIGELANEKV